MIDLDALIEHARAATVRRAAAERYVRELERRVADVEPARRWTPWLAAGLGAAAVAAIVFWLAIGRGGSPVMVAVAVGERVAIVVDRDTTYRVVEADSDATLLEVTRGVVTARLWPGARPHRLVLSGGGITAVATGTVYSLAVRPGGSVVGVIEGHVEVETGGIVHTIRAGETWPAEGQAGAPEAGRLLLALSTPWGERGHAPPVDAAPDVAIDEAIAAPPDAAAPDAPGGDAAVDAGRLAAATDAGVVHPASTQPPPSPVPSIKDRWRTARLLRGQGRFTDAVAECLAIAGTRDAVWSPIALVEAIQIELHQLADPKQAIALADRMLRDWPADPLVSEARDLRCRALRQIGRGAECAAAQP